MARPLGMTEPKHRPNALNKKLRQRHKASLTVWKQIARWFAEKAYQLRVKRQHQEPVDPVKVAINRMTNWQRNQWHRAGAKNADAEKYSALKRPA